MHPDSLWYKNAIFYELHVRTFYDSNGDGVGDFLGATQKLDYLQDLGITCIWLLPFYNYEVVNGAAQLRRETSLLRRVQVLIHTRKRHTVFGHGSSEILYPANPHILTYLRQDTTETVLVVHNLSGAVQPVELDLARFREHTPVEMFENTAFPKIDTRPYFLSLGPYGFHWFQLTRGGYE